jgi:hypothetical protein
MTDRRIVLGGAILLSIVSLTPLGAAEPQSITVSAPSHAPVSLSAEDLAQLPTTQLDGAFLTEQGKHQASFEGPLLWAVLQKAGVIDPAKPREQVAQSVVIVGRDGYQAVLGLGEIAPEFEGKQVILAEKMDGQTLTADKLRVVVPLDKRGGRSVRDVTRIEVIGPPTVSQ